MKDKAGGLDCALKEEDDVYDTGPSLEVTVYMLFIEYFTD